jgi:hypothetical protein
MFVKGKVKNREISDAFLSLWRQSVGARCRQVSPCRSRGVGKRRASVETMC